MSTDILDSMKDAEPAKGLTLFGKVFYVLEIALWFCTFLTAFFVPYFAMFIAAALLIYYIVMGSLFAFLSGAFQKGLDKASVIAAFISFPLILMGFMFTLQSWPFGKAMIIASFILSAASLVYIIKQLIKGTLSITRLHFTIMLVRLVPLVIFTAYMLWAVILSNI